MKMKEESSFLQGVESRLDSLFAEDTQPPKEKDSDLPKATIEEVASDIEEDIRKVPDIIETSRKPEVSADPIQTQDKSSFISEIEKRFSAIFGDEDKDASAVTGTAAPEDLKEVIAQAEPAEIEKSDLSLDDISSPPSSIYHSPLKDMKSIILSIEWEINDHILEQLEEEINKLYLLYTGDRIIQGFLRILRFMGRYIRVRGVRSNQDSINLLLFVYDHLENVMVSEGVTEAKRHIILIDNIKKYREWVELTDLETHDEGQVPESETREIKLSDVEPIEEKAFDDQKAEIEPLADIRAAQAESVHEAIIDKTIEEEPLLREPEPEDKIEFAIKEPDILAQTQPIAKAAADKPIDEAVFLGELNAEDRIESTLEKTDILAQTQPTPITEIPQPARGGEMEEAIVAMKDLPPHEALVYAMESIKKTFQAELDAMKEEIRILKSAR